MYNDGKRYMPQHDHCALFGVGVGAGAGSQQLPPAMENRFPYSILSKKQPLLAVGSSNGTMVKQQLRAARAAQPPPPPPGSLAASYLSALVPLAEGLPPVAELAGESGSTAAVRPASDASAAFYGNTVVTDVGICFSMSNVSLNGEPFRAPVPALPAHQRRRSHEDPGPETALINSRRRAAAFVAQGAGQYPHRVVDDVPPPPVRQLHHHQHHTADFGSHKHHQPGQAPSFPGVHCVQQAPPLHHAVTNMSLQHQQQPQQACIAAHPVSHHSLPRQRSLVLPGKGARSSSTDMAGLVRGVGSSGVGAGSGSSRSSPPYFKQPVGGSKAHLGQPPSSTTALGSGSSARRVPMQYFPAPTPPPPPPPPANVASPPTAVLEYYRLAIESAESVDQTSVGKVGGSAAPGVPLVDYSEVEKLCLNCGYAGAKQTRLLHSPSPTSHTPPSLAPPQASILSRSCPCISRGLQYPPSPLNSHSSPNSSDCQSSVTTGRAAGDGLVPPANGQVGNHQRRHAEEMVHPMEICCDGEGNGDGKVDDKPQDLSMPAAFGAGDDLDLEVANRRLLQAEDHGKRELKVAPKKKWIRHYMKDEPLVNGHSTAPPLIVISNNGTLPHAKHLTTNHVSLVAATTTTTLASSPMTIDLSTKGLHHQQNAQYQLPSGGHQQQQHAPTVHPALGAAGIPTTPPASNLASLSSSSSSSSSSSPSSSSSSSSSSSCSSNSSAGSTLTVSPIDDSQSSLNLSNGSSINGYISSSHSANSSTVGGTTTTIATVGGSGSSPLAPGLGGILPVSINGVLQASATVSIAGTINGSNAIVSAQHPGVLSHLSMDLQQQVAAHSPSAGAGAGAMFANVPTGTRRRTTSSNSNGVGTREVHNKLEKNRRAHLKECFEQLKKQLSLQPDEKKISNLSILHAAIRHIQLLKRKEREFEHEMERLAKEKIAAQNRILLLKREITQMGDIDVSRLAPDTDITPNPSSGGAPGSLNLVTGGVQSERDQLTENAVIGAIMQGRNGVRYSSSSSLSSIATNASITNLPIQTTISPVLSVSSPSRGSPALLRSSTSPPSSSLVPSSLSVSSITPSVMLPLSLTTKGSNGLVSEAHNGPVGGSSTQPALKFTTAPLNGLNLSNAAVVNGSVTGPTVTMNGTTATSAPLPVIVGANGTTSIVGITHPQLLTTTAAPSIQTLPLNLNVTSSAMSNGLSGNGGPTSIAITTSNGGSSGGHLTAHQAIQLTGSSNGSSGGSVNGSSITTTASGTNARSVYNAAIANGTTTIATTTLAGTMVMTAAGLPLLAANGKELINGTIGKNGTVRTDTSKLEIIATQSQPTNHTAAVGATAALDPPGTKVITLMNGSHTFALGPLEKDSKMGSVVYSPILVPTPQGLRVIQPGSNGLATIELAPPNGGNRLQLHLTH